MFPRPVVVGFSGWGQFPYVFAGVNALNENRIYAVNSDGQLLSYTDNGAPGNVGPEHVTVGADGWDQFVWFSAGRNVFGEPRIYTVKSGDNAGQLLAYTDNAAPGNVGHPVVVGADDWNFMIPSPV